MANKYDIGVITFFNANNYGAVLQTFALQYFLNTNNIESCVINTDWQEKEKLNSITGVLYYVKNYRNISKKKKSFLNFIDKSIPLSRYYSFNQINEVESLCSYFVVGSDQVWNPQWNYNRNIFFLTFTDNKYSYAASFGSITDTLRKRNAIIKNDLAKFRHISVREKSAKEYLKSLGIESDVNCDPTFLLDKNDWEKIETKPKNLDDKFVVIYLLEKNTQLINDAKAFSKKHHFNLCSIVDTSKKSIDGVKTISYSSPEEFIYILHHSEAIFTNSFHGTAFSIIFEKEFFAYLQNRKNAPNDRIINLLESTNLESRLVKGELPNEKCDFLPAKEYMKSERKRSLSYFKNILSNKYANNGEKSNISCYYYARSKQQDVVLSVRSGGVSTSISNFYFDNGWATYGAILESNKVIVKKLNSKEDILKAANSKYVESDSILSIDQVKTDLLNGQKVFYCALPCQIQMLLNNLKINQIKTDNLITADIVCHGVPEAKYFIDYCNFLRKKHKSEITDFNFRDKKFGWDSHYETYIVNGKMHASRIYTQLFYSNYLLKKCCFDCPYANLNRNSDITLMDSWGYTKPAHYKDGASIIIVNTDKGRNLLNSLSNIDIEPITRLEYLQPNLLSSSKAPNDIELFKEKYKKNGFSKIISFGTRNIRKKERINKFKGTIVKILRFLKIKK